MKTFSNLCYLFSVCLTSPFFSFISSIHQLRQPRKSMQEFPNQTVGLKPSETISTQARYVIAGAYALLAVTAISLNTPVLVTFIKDRTLLTPSNTLILSIAVGDWLHAVLAYPLGAVMNASRGSHAMTGVTCTWYAFITAFLSFGVMLHHATFAIERAIVIHYAVIPLRMTKNLYLVIAALWGFALLWSCFPLFGWSAYAPEGGHAFCSIHWQSSEPRDIAFIGCIFFFFFLGPIFAMVTAYSTVYYNAKQMVRRAHEFWGMNAAATKETLRAETKTTRMAFMMSFCFLFAWTPYATVSLYAVVEKPEIISPLVATLPALFAKTAACYNPIIYFFMFKKFRESLRKTMRPLCAHFLKQETSSANFELMKEVSFLTDKNSKKESSLEVTQEREGDSIRVNDENRDSLNSWQLKDKPGKRFCFVLKS